MPLKDLRDLFLLAALWGSSFLFMRLAVNDFGPVAFIELRIGISAVFLLAISALMNKLQALKTHWKRISVCGILNVGLPFFGFAYAAQTMSAGSLAVIDALVPLFGALIARVWLRERLTGMRALGLAIGFAGVIVLVYKDLSFDPNGDGWAVVAAISAPFFYGVAACYSSKYMQGIDPIACATGSMLATAIMLLPLAIWMWPASPVSSTAWLSVISVAILCTGIAYVIFFRLIASVGASRTITVTFLIPPFGVFWGVMLLGEQLTANIVVGAVIVLAGALLATGFIGGKTAPRPAS